MDRAARLCDLLVASILNHILAFEECLSAATVAHYAPMTLARSVLDAAVQYCYMTDADSDASTRLIRAGAVLLGSAHEEVTAVRHARKSLLPGILGIVDPGAGELEAQIRSAGIEINKPTKGRVSLRWPGGRSINLGVSVTAAQEKYIPNVQSSYRFGSGASNAMEWMLHDPADEAARVYMACGAADLSLAALSAVADHAGQYTGHEAASVRDRIAHHRRVLVARDIALGESGFQSIPRHAGKARLDGSLG